MTARSDSALRDRLSCSATLRHFGIWQAMVATVASSALAALLAWVFFWPEPLAPIVWTSVVLAASAVVAIAASLFRVEPGTLQRQQGRWTFAADSAPGAEPIAGELVVAFDLGSFLLLVFSSVAAPSSRATRRWLPAQKRGLESDWHALRAAVHAPRPQRDTPRAGASAE